MTDFELITLYTEQIALLNTVTTLLFTILFSYLIAMYFVSRRLSGFLFWILNGLFFMIMFAQSGAVHSLGARAVSIGIQIVARIEAEGSEIAWLSMRYIPPNIPRVMYYFFIVGTILAIVYAVIRRRDKNEE